ncbi:conjugal transfer protein TraD [Legionella pneumophila serogroup 1]|uniref:conjugal transfer protein TraD n=1 Tax=Legionella pneumophila TaxID=446 RepID=UPI001A26D7C4|nr:conjugal transfer protein TraD [Legionella pneumophila]HAT9741614.1 conjugal transfer protein TraD [Legionella pneumophila subsp. pneumophila]MCH9059791.1 conjugal transfer protein TraD [Legionella pneumophila serogroup 1]MCH9071799.1 conjugal transfer protein TraD [Legionella pneumophila serogroup 1]MCH9077829.1 conjugal transfer protein TraD [Legionella pneumophila serogroup 1]MCH9080753.1 conjugal transfer protein TraD [Legionella pneumophila serogroup 1]
MSTHKHIKKQQQVIAKCQKSLALDKIKMRRADTRRKIELGGIVIKSGFDGYSKSVILGGLNYLLLLIKQNPTFEKQFCDIGNIIFSIKK